MFLERSSGRLNFIRLLGSCRSSLSIMSSLWLVRSGSMPGIRPSLRTGRVESSNCPMAPLLSLEHRISNHAQPRKSDRLWKWLMNPETCQLVAAPWPEPKIEDRSRFNRIMTWSLDPTNHTARYMAISFISRSTNPVAPVVFGCHPLVISLKHKECQASSDAERNWSHQQS